MSSDDELFSRILRGSVHELPRQKSKIVSIFLSSTFTDMKNERDILVMNVFPKLKDYCKMKYNLEFQVIDMRWGIESFSNKANLSGQFCLDEVHTCNEISAKPCFIALVSHRYGSPFLPAIIKSHLFEAFVDALKTSKDAEVVFEAADITKIDNLVKHCYKLDENVEPSIYRLQDLDAIVKKVIKNPADVSPDDTKKLIKNTWTEMESKLIELLQWAATRCFEDSKIDRETLNEFFLSVTEKEIHEGIMNIPEKNRGDQALVFIRNMPTPSVNNESPGQLLAASRYFEIDSKTGATNEGNVKRLNHMKNALRNSLSTCPSNLVEFNNVTFNPNEFIVQNNKIINESKFIELNKEYFDEFERVFMAKVKELIKKEQSKRAIFENLSSDDSRLINEVLIHVTFAKQLNDRFLGRVEFVEKIKSLLQSGNSAPLMILGRSGCGKSSLVAKTFWTILDHMKPKKNYVAIVRFLGTTPTSSSISKTFSSIIRQLVRLFALEPVSEEQLNSMKNVPLMNKLVHVLAEVDKKEPAKRILIFLDSVDQLIKSDYSLDWLPVQYPSNTTFVYSFINDSKEINLVDNFNNRFSRESFRDNYILLDRFGEEESLDILNKMLESNSRKIKQYNNVKNLIKRSDNLPLHLKLVYNIASKWPSYLAPDAAFFKLTTVDRCITYIFNTLENDYGKILIERCLFHLTSSGDSGISDVEMADALSLDQELLNHIFEFHLPSDRRFPTALWNRVKFQLRDYLAFKEIDDVPVFCWYHRKFWEAAARKYTLNLHQDILDRLHLNLLDVFTEKYKLKPKRLDLEINKRYNTESLIFTGPQPLNLRRLNRTLEIVQKLSKNLRREYMIKKIFLDYEFILKNFQRYFNMVNYSLSENITKELIDLLSHQDDDDDEGKSLGLLSILIQFIYMNIGDKLNKYPESLAVQIESQLLSLYGISSHITKFIDECDRKSYKDCALVATYQNQQFLDARKRLLRNLFKRMVYLQNFPGGYYLILCEQNSFFDFFWNQRRPSDSTKEMNLPMLNENYKFFKAFEVFKMSFSNAIVAATNKEAIYYDLNNHEHYKLIELDNNDSNISDIFVLGSHSMIVFYENVDYLEFYGFSERKCFDRIKFGSKIRMVKSNKSSFLGWTRKDYNEPFYLCVVLENNSFHVLESLYTNEHFTTNEKLDKSFAFVYSYQFYAHDIISVMFQTRLFSNFHLVDGYCKVELFVSITNGKCVYLEVKNDNSCMIEGVQLLPQDGQLNTHERNLTILSFIGPNFVALKDDVAKQVYIYNTKLKQCITINGDFKRVSINFDTNDDFGLINAQTDSYMNVYIFKMRKENYEIITIIEYLSFTDDLYYVSFSPTFFTALFFLNDGSILDVDLSSVIIGYAQDDLYDKVDYEISAIKAFKSSRNLLTWSNDKTDPTINVWNYLNGRLLKTIQPKSDFNFLLDIFIGQKTLFVLREKTPQKLIVNIYSIDIEDSYELKMVKKFKLKYKNRLSINFNEEKESLTILTEHDGEKSLKISTIKFHKNSWSLNESGVDIRSHFGPSFEELGPWHTAVINSKHIAIGCANVVVFVQNKSHETSVVDTLRLDDEESVEQMVPVQNSLADLMILTNRNQLLLIDRSRCEVDSRKAFSRDEDIKISVQGSALVVDSTDSNYRQLTIFNSSAPNFLSNLTTLFVKRFQANELKLFALTPDCKYLATYGFLNNMLTLYRLNINSAVSSKPRSASATYVEIARVPLFSRVNRMTATNDFILLSIQEKRILSYLILDPLNDKKSAEVLIGQLPSRQIDNSELNFVQTDRIANALFQIYVNKQRLEWQSIFCKDEEEVEKSSSKKKSKKSDLSVIETENKPKEAEDLKKDSAPNQDGEAEKDQAKLLSKFDYTDIYAKQSFLCLKKLKLKIKAHDYEMIKVKSLDLESITDENGATLQNSAVSRACVIS